ncbi:MAG: ChrR family anti-sigma-E factor [Rhizobiaceae bacterium]|nr:ChrR family anti-sigma-E factor [Rhizobiaceae bacterium]
MSIAHHPTDETLMRYSAGTLGTGPAIVVGAHVLACPRCRSRVGIFEAIGGAVLNETEPSVLAPDSLARTLARIEAKDESGTEADRSTRPITIDGVRLPDTLRGCEIRRWRWIGPGIRMSRVGVPHDPDANMILLKVAPGRALPDHGHAGTEFTYIVSGSYSDALGQFAAGDIAEMDEDIEHQPIVDTGSDCICLAALEGKMRFNSLLGRLLQPIFGI